MASTPRWFEIKANYGFFRLLKSVLGHSNRCFMTAAWLIDDFKKVSSCRKRNGQTCPSSLAAKPNEPLKNPLGATAATAAVFSVVTAILQREVEGRLGLKTYDSGPGRKT